MSGHSDFGIFNDLGASSIFILVYAVTVSACVLRAPHRLSPSGLRGAPRSEHLSIRVRSYHDQLHGPILFPQHLFSVHDHGRQRSGRGPQHIFLPLRWPDCTLSRLRVEDHDRPVTQSIATPEPSSRTIPTLDRTLVAR